jgi:hypothetical protein
MPLCNAIRKALLVDDLSTSASRAPAPRDPAAQWWCHVTQWALRHPAEVSTRPGFAGIGFGVAELIVVPTAQG